MKRRINRELLLFTILIPLFLWIAFYISDRREDTLPNYSVINKSRMGCSVFFEALKELNYPVGRSLKPLSSKDSNSIQFITNVSRLDINNNEIKNWVNSGGILVILAPIGLVPVDFGVDAEPKNFGEIYKHGNGVLITSDIGKFTNNALIKNKETPYQLLSELNNYPNRKIFFNEAHLFSPTEEKSLWDYTSVEVKFMFYQLVLVLAAFFTYKGRRFGKAISYHEETERSENEYLYSTSALYRHARCWDIMLDNYYRSLLNHLGHSHDTWLDDWEREGLPNLDKAKRVYDFMNNKDKDSRRYLQIVNDIEHLENTVKQRRDSYWKVLKKPM